jgi:hypothetical protein
MLYSWENAGILAGTAFTAVHGRSKTQKNLVYGQYFHQQAVPDALVAKDFMGIIRHHIERGFRVLM